MDKYAICIKASSKVDIYKNNPDKMKGCVFYPAGQIPFFGKETAIEPDNQIPISHELLSTMNSTSQLTTLGTMPDNFKHRLIKAVEDSNTMSKNQKTRILELMKE